MVTKECPEGEISDGGLMAVNRIATGCYMSRRSLISVTCTTLPRQCGKNPASVLSLTTTVSVYLLNALNHIKVKNMENRLKQTLEIGAECNINGCHGKGCNREVKPWENTPEQAWYLPALSRFETTQEDTHHIWHISQMLQYFPE